MSPAAPTVARRRAPVREAVLAHPHAVLLGAV